MAINIKGIEHNKNVTVKIKENDIRNTVVKVPSHYYQAKATLETWYGSVEITGSTLHNIIQQFLVQNKHFRSVIKGFIDDLDNGDEYLYNAKKY
tara:strand:+ start:960 stop:1241 length:282 start_codon:yes stop_codon:yes gene_type:complete